MHFLKGEDAVEVANDSLDQVLPGFGRRLVRYVMSDSPTVKLLCALQKVFPNLHGLALDACISPLMINMRNTQAHARLQAFRQLVAKAFRVDFSKGELSWGCLHDSPSDSPLTQEEEKWRAQILCTARHMPRKA